MVSVCFYFQVHQPIRLRKYSVFDIGNNQAYWDDKKNWKVLDKVSKKCYLPMNSLLLNLIRGNNQIKVSFSFTNIILEQMEKNFPKVLSSFQALVDTGNVEILDESSHHSLSSLYSENEFADQVKVHSKRIKILFGQTPKIFRNTELIYNNEIAKKAESWGYDAILAEGADNILGWRNSNFVYRPAGCKNIRLLMKNYKMSDDIAFRFSDRSWKEWPLNIEKYSHWINSINGNGNVLNLFMDYETFGEHQWEDTGIFNFMQKLPGEILKNPDNNFMTPSEVIKKYDVMDYIDVPNTLSWADIERDVSAWTGNQMQKFAIRQLYALEMDVKRIKNKKYLDQWRKLQTSDHFYYMCTKWFNDGDVHKYFNPYDSPYDAFVAYMNVLSDFRNRINSLSHAEEVIK